MSTHKYPQNMHKNIKKIMKEIRQLLNKCQEITLQNVKERIHIAIYQQAQKYEEN